MDTDYCVATDTVIDVSVKTVGPSIKVVSDESCSLLLGSGRVRCTIPVQGWVASSEGFQQGTHRPRALARQMSVH